MIAVSGSTGLIGSALVDSLRRDGHQIRRMVRSRPSPGSEHILWDPESGTLDPGALVGVDAVVHLAGENVGERWTAEKKARIRDSRVRGTRLLAEAIAALDEPPRVLVCASAVGIYGDRGDEILDEDSRAGLDFLARVGQEWEAASEPAAECGARVVKLRFGVVLSPRGGALEKMLLPFRIGVGGKVGSGQQWMSWISLTDAVAAIRFALETATLEGPVNTVAPHPVTNAEFTGALGDVLGRPTVMTVPAFALRLAYGEMADATLLASQRARPRKLQEAGFRFQHPELRDALRAELADG
ncbi:hypothetical protein BH23GEM3_BH23GEM3_06010 [soil metagenome]